MLCHITETLNVHYNISNRTGDENVMVGGVSNAHVINAEAAKCKCISKRQQKMYMTLENYLSDCE